MTTKDANVFIIQTIKNFIDLALEYREECYLPKNKFTRKRKMDFKHLLLMILNLNKRSLSIELEDFFNVIGKPDITCTKSAFCQQRENLDDRFLRLLNQVLIGSFYYFYGNKQKRWKSLRVMTIDGSTQYLINTLEVVKHFGVQVNQSVEVPMGRIVNCFDLLNQISIRQDLVPIKLSEQLIANYWLYYDYLPSDAVYLYDRGFPSFNLMWLHMHNGKEKKFVMRCRKNFNKEVEAFYESNEKDKVITLYPTQKSIDELSQMEFNITEKSSIKVRLVKIELSSGEKEILITNLMNKKKYSYRSLKWLYGLRWGIETEYDAWKNIYQLEVTSGKKPLTIMQDFYATVFIANLHNILMKEGDKEVKKKTKGRKLKYKINRNVTCGLLKNRIVKIFLEEDVGKILEEIKRLFVKYIEPVRKRRRYERKEKCRRKKGRHQPYTNYKRAV